jgi:hypothetical protein
MTKGFCLCSAPKQDAWWPVTAIVDLALLSFTAVYNNARVWHGLIPILTYAPRKPKIASELVPRPGLSPLSVTTPTVSIFHFISNFTRTTNKLQSLPHPVILHLTPAQGPLQLIAYFGYLLTLDPRIDTFVIILKHPT